MSKNEFEHGYAFVLEGDTEREFYDALLHHFAEKRSQLELELQHDSITKEPYYVLCGYFGKRIIRMNSVGTITQIHNSYSWLQNSCLTNEKETFPWTVFLCYDTEEYQADVTKFYKGDWKSFRKRLSKTKRVNIVDLAADADIEDIFLLDLHGISIFMGLEQDLAEDDIPTGGKGSARMKQLFIAQRGKRKTKQYYHKGERARPLIDCLDFDKIIATSELPFSEVEKIFL